MTPDSIRKYILPHVNMDGLSDITKAVVLTAMYDLNILETGEWQRLIDFLKTRNFTSPIIAPATDFRRLPYSMGDYFKTLWLPVSMHEEKRFEHTWICAKHGSGKSTLIESLIFHDLEKVKENRATVLVMDSQGRHELLGRIERSFPCTVIDTSTSMNIFAPPRPARNARDQEILETNQTDLISYVFSTTLGEGGNFTPKQRTLFNYMVQFVMAANGSVADMLRLLLPKGIQHYPNVIPRLSPPAQLFFSTQFDDPKQYTDTKKELHWRLDAILQRPSFARMFTQRQTLDLYSILQKPQCIVVDTDKALLGQQGCEIFGRFMIAMLLSASQQRATVSSTYRLPTYCYIDEAHDFIATDKNIEHIIDQARKMRMAFTFAHQRENQIREPTVLDAMHHCSIKFTKQPPEKFSPSLPPYSFYYLVDGLSPIIVKAKLKDRPAIERHNVPATTTPIVHGEVLPPEPPKALPGRKWGEDDIDESPR